MLPDYSRYYGSALTQIVDHCVSPITIARMNVRLQGFYLLDGKLPLYIKFSRNRKSPWSFTFQRDQQVQYRAMIDEYGECVMTLVCGADGIVALSHDQVRQVLCDRVEEQGGITIRRKLNEMYSVVGPNGKLSTKVARDSLIQLASRLLGHPLMSSEVLNEPGQQSGDDFAVESRDEM